ncbi:MAG: Na+/glucose cotransporter, partial [Pseudopedobacter saltans]
DIYVKKINPNATTEQIIKVGRRTVLAGCVFAILVALAIDSIKGLKLFDIFQAVLGFIAPPLTVVFLLAVFWKKTTKKAVDFTLSWGSAISLGIGVIYLWVLPARKYHFWPHYLLLSFCIFMLLITIAFAISLLDKQPITSTEDANVHIAKPNNIVKWMWGLLSVVMILLYILFR